MSQLIKVNSTDFYVNENNIALRSSSAGSSIDSVEIVLSVTDKLDSIFNNFPNPSAIINASIIKKYNSLYSDSIVGILLHYDMSDSIVIKNYERNGDDSYTFRDLPVSKASMVILDNIILLGNNEYDPNIIECWGSTSYMFSCSSCYGDVELLHTALEYDIYTPSTPVTYSWEPHPCHPGVHYCKDDRTGPHCAPMSGCTTAPDPGDCPFTAARDLLVNEQENVKLDTLDNNLPTTLLYEFKDSILQTIIGQKYVDSYYAIKGHFFESLDLSLAFKIVLRSSEIKNFISAYISNNSRYTLNATTFNNIKEISDISKNNSSSSYYKEFVDEVISELDNMKGKNISEIKNYLNN